MEPAKLSDFPQWPERIRVGPSGAFPAAPTIFRFPRFAVATGRGTFPLRNPTIRTIRPLRFP